MFLLLQKKSVPGEIKKIEQKSKWKIFSWFHFVKFRPCTCSNLEHMCTNILHQKIRHWAEWTIRCEYQTPLSHVCTYHIFDRDIYSWQETQTQTQTLKFTLLYSPQRLHSKVRCMRVAETVNECRSVSRHQLDTSMFDPKKTREWAIANISQFAKEKSFWWRRCEIKQSIVLLNFTL